MSVSEPGVPLTWDELEQPVLMWLLTSDEETLDLDFSAPTSPLAADLTDTEVDEALSRLEHHGLIAGTRAEGSGAVWWSQLRLTADGLRVLGEWPPAEGATINEALVLILRELAGDLPDEEAITTKRAGSAISRMTGGAVLDAIKGESYRVGGELAS